MAKARAEDAFRDTVVCYLRNLVKIIRTDIEVVGDYKKTYISSSLTCTGTSWKWKHHRREIDVIVGFRVTPIEDNEQFIPIIAIELKTGTNLVTTTLEAGLTMYRDLKLSYPWVHTIFIGQHVCEKRNMSCEAILHNGRGYDTIITDWNKQGRSVLKKCLLERIPYIMDYWGIQP